MKPEDRDHLARHLSAGDLVAQQLGIELLTMDAGCASAALTVRADMSNGHGLCHGGIIFTLADTTFGFAANSRNVPGLAFSASINYLSPGRLGERLHAGAMEVSRTGRTAIYDVTVRGEDGRTIALLRGTARLARGERILDGIDPD